MISVEQWRVAIGYFTQRQKQDNAIQLADDDVQIGEDDNINLVIPRFDSTRSSSILVFALM